MSVLSTSPQRRRWLSRLPLQLLLAAGVLLLLAPATNASGFTYGCDWRHLAQVAGHLSTLTPKRPVVYLLGGSAARECTISDDSWRAAVREAGGPDTLAYNLGASGQTYEDNLLLIEKLPRVPSIVIIGVIVGRYTRTGARGLPDVEPGIAPYPQHRFTLRGIRTDAVKRFLVTDWLTRRYPVFQDRFPRQAQKLDALVARCIELGFHPVMLNLPLNQEIVKDRLDKPRRRYREHCQAVATKYDVPWVNWLPTIPLVSRDFSDNWHLVEPGRVKWQRRLTTLTVTTLRRYDME